MLYRILIGLLILAQTALQAESPAGYYDAAQGKSEAGLRSALHRIVHNQQPLAYSGSPHPNTADALNVLDQDPANTNNVRCIYSGYSIAKTNIGTRMVGQLPHRDVPGHLPHPGNGRMRRDPAQVHLPRLE